MNAEEKRAYMVAYRREYRPRNLEKLAAADREYYIRNRERLLAKAREYRARKAEYVRAYREQNKKQAAAQSKRWKATNRERTRVLVAARQARTRQATPPWADAFFLREIYDLAAQRTRLRTGGHRWHVDHVIPLRGADVSGLHVHTNLQVIPAIANLRKRATM